MFCTFWLGNVLRTTACVFSTAVVRATTAFGQAGRCCWMSEYVRGRYQFTGGASDSFSKPGMRQFLLCIVAPHARLTHLGVHPSDGAPVLVPLGKHCSPLKKTQTLPMLAATPRVELHQKVLMPPPRALLIMVRTVRIHPASDKPLQLLHQEHCELNQLWSSVFNHSLLLLIRWMNSTQTDRTPAHPPSVRTGLGGDYHLHRVLLLLPD